ncbi:MAG: iron-containing alcohol dehydrogenase [Verrucomicrobiia bacterium]
MNFDFATAALIVFGAGRLREVGAMARELGRRAFVVTGSSTERAKPLLAALASHDVESVTFPVAGEPTTEVVQRGTQSAREQRCELVIGFGGGSAIDTAKAVAALLTNGGDLLDYLEVIGKGKPLAKPSAPYVAIPTTAGTGSEVTRNAVLGSPDHRVKVSLRSPLMLPRVALVDPELTYDLPREVTASTGLDALTQLIEAFVSNRANPMTDALCREGIRRVARSLRPAYETTDDPPSLELRRTGASAREDMSLAALFSGLALANAGLGAVHGFAAPIGGMFHAPHGAVCATLLPHVMEVNLRALRARQPRTAVRGKPESEALRRYEEIDRVFGGEAIAWIHETCRSMKIPPLSKYGVREKDFPVLVEKAAIASSMRRNPITLTPDELCEILEREAAA